MWAKSERKSYKFGTRKFWKNRNSDTLEVILCTSIIYQTDISIQTDYYTDHRRMDFSKFFNKEYVQVSKFLTRGVRFCHGIAQ